MIRLTRIQPLTDFLRNHRAFIANLKKAKSPTVLTVNGKAALVIQDTESYQELLDKVAEAEFVAAVEEGLAQDDSGRSVEARAALADLRKKLFGVSG